MRTAIKTIPAPAEELGYKLQFIVEVNGRAEVQAMYDLCNYGSPVSFHVIKSMEDGGYIPKDRDASRPLQEAMSQMFSQLFFKLRNEAGIGNIAGKMRDQRTRLFQVGAEF